MAAGAARGAGPAPVPGIAGCSRPPRDQPGYRAGRAPGAAALSGHVAGGTPGHGAAAGGPARPAGGQVRPAGVKTRLAGRYVLEERLTEQSGSSVWRATDEALARPVIICTFAPGFGRARAGVAAARAACRVSDHRLLRIFDADDHPGHPYIVTEWPSGTRLDRLLAAGPLGPQRAAQIIAEAAAALAVAPAAGLAHLCLTPDVLWWNRWGEVKISGLGTAAALAGVRAADPALADTRGLARLLYAALTGLWPGTEQTTLPAAPRPGGRAPSPRAVRPGVPADLDALTCRALFGPAGGDGHSIAAPAELAQALAEIAYPGRPLLVPSLSPDLARTQPLSLPPGAAVADTRPVARVQVSPLPVARVQVSRAAPTVVSLSPPPARQEPAGQEQADHEGAGQEQAGWEPDGRPEAGRDGAGRGGVFRGVARVLRGAAAGLVLAAIVATAVLIVRGLTAPAPGGSTARGGGATPARQLTPVKAVTFDPYGDGQGENGQLSHLAIDASPATAWHTNWYTTASFGNLKPGTGLLLDMDHTVTITDARITLGTAPGTALQLRAGAAATSLSALKNVASAAGASGQVDLRPTAPVTGRYVLIWLTRLPPDTRGTFQAAVYDIRLEGRA